MSRLLLLAFAGIGSASAGFVGTDGTIRNAEGDRCASNVNGLIRMVTCNTNSPQQQWEYDAVSQQVKNPAAEVCWWIPTTGDQNKKVTNQRVWTIRCDMTSPRLSPTQLQFYLDGTSIKNVYTDSVATDYCLIGIGFSRPLKMKPCSHNRKFALLV